MDTPADPQQVSFTNEGGKISIQAGTYVVHGDNVVQARHDQDPLHRLPYAAKAPFNSYTKQHEPICLPNTRVDLLQLIYNWAGGQDERCIFWLNGLAGTGKSTIARTVARNYFNKKRLGASFFFSRGGGDVSHAGKFVTSIAVQLASSIPTLHQHIGDAFTEHSNIASQSLSDQWHELVLRPLSKLDGKGCQSLYILVVDALDECDDENNIRILLYLLAEARSLVSVRLRVFLTSRPEVPIRYGFCQIPDAEHQDFVLHNISPSIVDHDISVFLEHNLRMIRQERSLDSSWPDEGIIRHLVQNACGLFIWAATACRFIREGKQFAAKRLNTILQGNNSAPTAPEKHLNEIYTTILKQSITPEYADEEEKELCYMLRQILGSVVILFSPLSTYSLSRLLCVTEEDINQTLDDLHSILDVPKDQTQPLRLYHPSFRDFLLNRTRCGDRFWVEEKNAHRTLANHCIQLMRTLKQDICRLQAPGRLAAEVDNSLVQQCIRPEVQYACLYWVEHLQRGGNQPCDDDQVDQILQDYLLYWLEALSLMGRTSDGVLAISSLESFVQASTSPTLYALIHDARRFVLRHRWIVEHAPLQIYLSALIFTPENSIVRGQFKKEMPSWMERLPKMQSDWGATLQALEGHSGYVNSVAFSPDGKLVASGSDDRTARLWNAGTGAPLQTLEGHSDSVISVALSLDGKLVASGSADETVRLWDAGTSAPLQTLEGHSSYVSSVAFSPDGKLVASGSDDKTVRLWDAGTGALLQTLEGHSSTVNSVAFSPDGELVASGSADKTVRLWDAGTGAPLQTLEGHSRYVSLVAFSPDSKLVALGSYDHTDRFWDVGNHTVRLWDVGTGTPSQTLEGHSDLVSSVAFSPDGKLVASGSLDKTIRLWEAGTGAPLQIFKLDPPASTLSFSTSGQYLITDKGVLHVSSLLDSSEQALSLFVSNDWVIEEGQRILWLPPDYRATCVAVWNGMVVLGHKSGGISFLEFKQGPKTV